MNVAERALHAARRTYADGGGTDPRGASQQLSPSGLYSQGAATAAALPQAKGPPQQMLGMLQNQGVKPAELENAGLPGALGDQHAVTREQLAAHLQGAMPDIQEEVRGYNPSAPVQEVPEDAVSSWVENRARERGGQHFDMMGGEEQQHHRRAAGREFDENFQEDPEFSHQFTGGPKPTKYEEYTLPGGENYRELLLHTKPDRFGEQLAHRSGHWDTPNVLAHLRLSDRTDPEGKKVLHIEELQSDWGQEGRKKGFAEPGKPGVPKGPYVGSTQGWTELGLKRALVEAARGGYDKMVWTPGQEQADRYDLSKKISHIVHLNNGDGTYYASAVTHGVDGEPVHLGNYLTPEQLENHVGKDVAHKIVAGQGEDLGRGLKKLGAHDLSVGGEGMKSYYDKVLPNTLSKITKKLDPTVRPEMKELSAGEATPNAFQTWARQNGDMRRSDQLGQAWHLKGRDDPAVTQFLDQHKGRELPGIDITPTMRAKILRGLPAFKRGGAIEPTEAQKAAGNYQKEHISFQGLPISIETKKGAERSGVDAEGKRWRCVLPYDYGYIKRTEGADGEHVDVCIGPHKDSQRVFVVNQNDHETGEFDEHKIMLGYNTRDQAEAAYKAGFSDGKGHLRMGHLVVATLEDLKDWLKHDDTTRENPRQKHWQHDTNAAKSDFVDAALRVTNHGAHPPAAVSLARRMK